LHNTVEGKINKPNEHAGNSKSFRDSMSIVSKEGKRVWVYPKKPKGKFYNARTWVSILLLLFLFVTPFIKISGHPFLLFNIIERKFIIFGIAFGPHDFYLFGLAVISFIVFIILFTAVFGRVFCGWICPQTVLLEMVFRKIEYWLEGDSLEQKRLNAVLWTGKKIAKKYTKYTIFFIISFIISNFLLAYIIGIDDLWKIVTVPPSEHISGFISILAFTALFYWIFAWFREQACILVCPYGRLQGVLLDPNSVVIAYDYVRGEPRGKLKKNEERTNGDCIDCNLCVEVCPTGIDIRNGTQLECVNCTACIDACDAIMDKVKKPRGLIRFASENNIKNKLKFKVTPRIIGYSALLVLLMTVLTIFMFNRSDIDVSILRAPGMLYQEQPGEMLSNLYNIKIVNKTFDEVPVNVKLENTNGEIKLIGSENIILEQSGILEGKFLVLLPKAEIMVMNTPLSIGVYRDNQKIDEIKTSFLGPVKENIK
jgi:cytochrome c oxidase accessory protein FixG